MLLNETRISVLGKIHFLPTQCIHMFRVIKTTTAATSLMIIEGLVFVNEMPFVLSEAPATQYLHFHIFLHNLVINWA